MSILAASITIALLALVILLVTAPLRAAERGGEQAHTGDRSAAPGEEGRDQLEAAREAKYHEIRDAELDYRTGKLSREDYGAIDAGLRAEAIEILDRLQELEPGGRQSGESG